MIDDLGGKMKTKKVGLRGKTYRYLIDKSSEDKEAKGTKNGVRKRKKYVTKNHKTVFKQLNFRIW